MLLLSFKTVISLSQIKKARLLQSLEQQPDVLPCSHKMEESSSAVAADPFDDEYAAFQSALAADLACDDSNVKTNLSVSDSKNKPSNSNDHFESGGYEDDHEANRYLYSLIGTKCRAPFSHDWGGLHYGNAMIISVDSGVMFRIKRTCLVMFINK